MNKKKAKVINISTATPIFVSIESSLLYFLFSIKRATKTPMKYITILIKS